MTHGHVVSPTPASPPRTCPELEEELLIGLLMNPGTRRLCVEEGGERRWVCTSDDVCVVSYSATPARVQSPVVLSPEASPTVTEALAATVTEKPTEYEIESAAEIRTTVKELEDRLRFLAPRVPVRRVVVFRVLFAV
jgi:hypothetical protein